MTKDCPNCAAMREALEPLKEIARIMIVYREQEASRNGVGTPGGLEHMGDVWKLLARWDRLIADSGILPSQCDRCNGNGVVEDQIENDSLIEGELPCKKCGGSGTLQSEPDVGAKLLANCAAMREALAPFAEAEKRWMDGGSPQEIRMDWLTAAREALQPDDLDTAMEAEDCPPSGILQEWQPWNGK